MPTRLGSVAESKNQTCVVLTRLGSAACRVKKSAMRGDNVPRRRSNVGYGAAARQCVKSKPLPGVSAEPPWEYGAAARQYVKSKLLPGVSAEPPLKRSVAKPPCRPAWRDGRPAARPGGRLSQ